MNGTMFNVAAICPVSRRQGRPPWMIFMTTFTNWLTCSALLLGGAASASAFTSTDAAAIFNAYNNAYSVGGYYPGWWTGAEEIEMAEDAFDNSPTPARQTIVSNACNQFISHQGASWIYNEYNDDISWAVIALARGYLITGDPNFRDVAKANWDAMYGRAWDTNFAGGGLWWRTDNQFKNAAVNGPALGAVVGATQPAPPACSTISTATVPTWTKLRPFTPGSDGCCFKPTAARSMMV